MPMPVYDPSLYYSLRARHSPPSSPAATEFPKGPAHERPERRETRGRGEVLLLALSAGSFLVTAGYVAYAMVMRFA